MDSRRTGCRCPQCGHCTTADVHDDRWRTVQDLPALQYRVFLRLRQRRFFYPRCQKRFLETFDSMDVKQRQTQRLQACLLQQARGRSLSEAARASPVTYRIICYLCFKVGRQCAEHRRLLPKRIGVDEVATKKGHRYATVVVALSGHSVFGVAPERTQAALKSLLQAPGARPGRVKEAVIDIWAPFYLAITACCPRACIVIDRFHVERHLWAAVIIAASA